MQSQLQRNEKLDFILVKRYKKSYTQMCIFLYLSTQKIIEIDIAQINSYLSHREKENTMC